MWSYIYHECMKVNKLPEQPELYNVAGSASRIVQDDRISTIHSMSYSADGIFAKSQNIGLCA